MYPILQKPYIYIYKASAGSGKTFTLVVHYLSLLVSNNNPEAFRHILAVTFTNKATAEMKQRIICQLFGLSNCLPESAGYMKAIQDITSLDEDIIRDRAQKALTSIIHKYHLFSVKTIDTFFKEIVTNIALELQLPAAFQIDVDDESIINEAVERIFNQAKLGSNTLNLILQFIDTRLQNDKVWDIRRDLKRFAMENLFNEGYMAKAQNLNKVLIDKNKITQYHQQIKGILNRTKEDFKGLSKEWYDALKKYGIEINDFSYGTQAFEAYFQTLSQGKNPEIKSRIRAKIESNNNWISKSNKRKEELQALVDEYYYPLLNRIEKNRQAKEIDYNNANLTLMHLNSLRLLSAINNTVKDLEKEKGHHMLARIPILIHNLIGSNDAPFVLEKAGTRYHHILIDEFQDTSAVQWENFQTLLVNSLAEGGTCLIVGDVKQSIYRWRGSDWRNLHEIGKRFKGQCIIKHLDTNYRSDSIIINFNNSFFKKATLLLNNNIENLEGIITEIYDDVEQIPKSTDSKGFVSVEFYEKETIEKKTSDNATQGESTNSLIESMLHDLGTHIKELHDRGLPYNEMTILTRTGENLNNIISYFDNYFPDIPLIHNEAFALKSSVSIKIIVATLHMLYDPLDLASSSYAAAQIQMHIYGNKFNWIDIAQNSSSYFPMDLCIKRDYWIKMPLYELIEAIIINFKLSEINGQDAYLHAFLDEVQSFITENGSDIKGFLNYWDEYLSNKKIPSTTTNGIRLLTIHKAKGLESHTVFLPFCNWEMLKDIGNIWCSPKKEPYNTLPMVPIKLNATMEKSIYSEDYKEEHKQEYIENLNLLYVAFTRARHNLFIQGISKPQGIPSDSIKTVSDLIRFTLPLRKEEENILTWKEGEPYVLWENHTESESCNPLETKERTLPSSFHAYNNCMKFQQSNESYEFTHTEYNPQEATRIEYIKQGNLLHKLFSSIIQIKDAERIISAYEEQGLFDAKVTADNMQTLWNENIKNPIIADWFSGEWKVYCEQEILTKDVAGLQIRRPDRIMIKNDTAVIVDLKFGKENKKYHDQVKEYISLLQQMGFSNVEGYLWFVYKNKIIKV